MTGEKSGSPKEKGRDSGVGHVLNEVEFQDFLRWKANVVLDKSMRMVLEEAADKVLGEEDGILGEMDENLPLVKAGLAAKNGRAEFDQFSEMTENQVDVVRGEKRVVAELVAFSGELEEAKAVAAAAVIPEAVISPTRSSPRLAGVVAEHALQRAERRVQSRNLEIEQVILDPCLVFQCRLTLR